MRNDKSRKLASRILLLLALLPADTELETKVRLLRLRLQQDLVMRTALSRPNFRFRKSTKTALSRRPTSRGLKSTINLFGNPVIMIHGFFGLLSYCSIISISFLSFTRAADHSPANKVTWLYPGDYTRTLTFNNLDIVNVSWISAYAPTFLDLACHNSSGDYSSALKIQVRATGNRLISLNPAATYESCRFELSAPENSSTISRSPNFDVESDELRVPAFWTLDGHAADGRQIDDADDGPCTRRSRHEVAMQNKQAMIGVGVGVAVGVFAVTTLVYTLIIVAIRKRQAQDEGKRRMGKKESMTKDWVLKSSLSSGDFCRGVVDPEGKNQSAAEEWMEKQIRNGDFYEVRRRSRVEL
ncbi:MAG: hypothetical protein Q9216_001369 [Gyalolechia sp. 2 TL-2023]